jgi:hypothetical protein
VLDRSEGGLRCLNQLRESAQLAVRSRLHQVRSFAYRLLWDLEPCMREAQKAVDYARASEDLRCLVRALNVMKSANNIGPMDRDRLVQIAHELLSLGERLEDNTLIAQSLIDEGHAYRITYSLQDAEPCAWRAFDVAQQSGMPDLIAGAAMQMLSLQACWWRFEHAIEVIAAIKKSEDQVSWPYRAHVALSLALLWGEADRYDKAEAELRSVGDILSDAMLNRKASEVFVAQPEIAIRLDYFEAGMAGRRGAWETGLSRFQRRLAMYESPLQEPRYRDLFACARIDLLLGRNHTGDDDLALQLLEGAESTWKSEPGLQPYHCAIVCAARTYARKHFRAAAPSLERALDFLDAEALVWPYGIDVGFARVAQAAREVGNEKQEARARASSARYRAQRLEAARDLVSV